jgi:site-specific DNA-methyltransferase (adenine-specific)
MTEQKKRAGMNRTLEVSTAERPGLLSRLLPCDETFSTPPTGTIHGDSLKCTELLPGQFVDLLFLDPPYNLYKDFNGTRFNKRDIEEYEAYLNEILAAMKPLLKKTASIYICGDWYSSLSIYRAASTHFRVRNRITWEREKGRGARLNWKNSSEDIWFCTMSDEYYFNVDGVKLRRKVMAPYVSSDGKPKDWTLSPDGKFRDTHPSNLWTDITVPFWSMPENTDHPTQKSEKLLARIILASTRGGDFVLDPFVGSGTTSVVARKLGRRYLGMDINLDYCLLTEKRLELADENRTIQGFSDGVFWERNSLPYQSSNG